MINCLFIVNIFSEREEKEKRLSSSDMLLSHLSSTYHQEKSSSAKQQNLIINKQKSCSEGNRVIELGDTKMECVPLLRVVCDADTNEEEDEEEKKEQDYENYGFLLQRNDSNSHGCVIGDPKQHCTSFHKCSFASSSSPTSPSTNNSLLFSFPNTQSCLLNNASMSLQQQQQEVKQGEERKKEEDDDTDDNILFSKNNILRKLPKYSIIEEINRLTADIAAAHPDMIHFQQVINTWV
ncbi:unnamed protein product [Dracunculus medinensis]|uniref:Uncharacterized protein n=1 Tax=Dracunculus medinensis TaxID=318479 RepID=A0A0N4U1Q6_DRAME|nr:unnamed protein product [Dracunculus medinensis]